VSQAKRPRRATEKSATKSTTAKRGIIKRPGVPPARARGDTRIAAIDIGSNSIRQIIADVSAGGSIRVIDEMKASPRLGAGIAANGALSETAMGQALDALTRMAKLAVHLEAKRVEVVATSAVRDASNSADFCARVRRVTGHKVRVLSGEEEAMLAFRSALAHFELGQGRAVVMDIGGGSLELALSADGLLERLTSLPFGALRLTEEFLGATPRHKDIEKLRKHVRPDLRKVLPVRDWRGATVIGSGGTFTNLAQIHLARRGLTSRSPQGTRIPRAELLHILEWLAGMTPAERATVPGLSPARADIILAGLTVAAEVLARLEASELQVSAYGIREGILLEAARVRPAVADKGEARARSLRAFAERCHFEAPHAEQVQRLALTLFDALGKRLGLGSADRQLLSDAALLHDVGYHIGYDKHHKHSYHLIMHADFLGMSPEEKVIIAHVARYHRGGDPKRKHASFAALAPEMQARITALAALLRIADGLDRGHVSAVAGLKVRWGPRSIRISVTPRRGGASGLRLELWGASRKAGLLGQVAGMPVELAGPDGTPFVPPELGGDD
jgi:exopolyphosphatase / guanosine-5'-triphosphate,3'-diphosphate pyrophosphatase